MIAPLLFAAALSIPCDMLPLGANYVVIDPPSMGAGVCVYQREKDQPWAIFLHTTNRQIDGPLCPAVQPLLEFGYMEVPQGDLCPSDPGMLDPLNVDIHSQ